MEIERDEDGAKGAFYVQGEGARAATMTFSRAGEKLVIIDHTEVSDALRGTGAGKKLVMAAVDWARSENLKIVPLCPFAKAVFERDASLADVLAS